MLASDVVLKAYRSIFGSETATTYEELTQVPLPSFTEACLISLCRQAQDIFESQPTVVEVPYTFVTIVGDLHGSIFDLLRILKLGHPSTSYVFLGDYVDRGSFSVEVITLLFALVVTYPNRFTLLRGNHEFEAICEEWGFKQNILELYHSDALFKAFISAFNYLPLAAVVDGSQFCVHGGISRRGKLLSDIAAIQRPISDYSENLFVKDLVWADVTENSVFFIESQRVTGCTNFGFSAVNAFLKDNNLMRIIRAHEYIPSAYRKNAKGLITVFSASSYKTNGSNPSAIAIYDGTTKSIHSKKFPAWPRPPREALQFIPIVGTEDKSLQKCAKAESWSSKRCMMAFKRPITGYLSSRTVGSVLRKPGPLKVVNFPGKVLRLTTPIPAPRTTRAVVSVL